MKKGLFGLTGLTFALFVAAIYMIIFYAPIEKQMGLVQKIFYLMVPMGWLAMLSFLVVFIASILFLVKRNNKWDILSYSSAEIGIIFTTLACITGAIWAKPTWGVWWDWGTPRLTSTLILWFIYLAYFVARTLASEESQGARFAAVIGIIGFVDIPIIMLSTTLWKGMHPPELIFEAGGLDPKMGAALGVNIIAFTALYALLLLLRISLRKDELEVKRLKELRN